MSSPRVVRTLRIAPLLAILLAPLGGGLLGPAGAWAQAAPDAFYVALLRDGKAEMLRGDAVAARKSFRLACFGFLEQPVLLAEGLVRLGLAEVALNDREAFLATFSRFAEVEQRFTSYAPAVLTADERKAFEAKALEWANPELMRSIPSLAPLVNRKSEIDLGKLSAKERGRELERRAAAEPGNAKWKVLLAKDDADAERWAKAVGRLEGVPDAAEGGNAGCLRGRALAELERCAEASAALSTCVPATSDALLAEAQIGCLVALSKAEEARAFASRLTRPVADTPAVRKAIGRIPAPTVPKAAATKPAPATPVQAPSREPARKPSGSPEKAAAAPPATDRTPGGKASGDPSAGKQADGSKPGSPPKASVGVPTIAQVSPPATGGSGAPAPAGKPAAPRLSTEEERLVAEGREMLKSVDNRDDLRRGFSRLQPVADRLPERSDLQLLAGEIAYRAGLWASGADYLKRATPGGRGPVDPTLRFYYAVCLYESGSYAAAADVASTGLEKLQRPPFVESYLQKIRAARP